METFEAACALYWGVNLGFQACRWANPSIWFTGGRFADCSQAGLWALALEPGYKPHATVHGRAAGLCSARVHGLGLGANYMPPWDGLPGLPNCFIF